MYKVVSASGGILDTKDGSITDVSFEQACELLSAGIRIFGVCENRFVPYDGVYLIEREFKDTHAKCRARWSVADDERFAGLLDVFPRGLKIEGRYVSDMEWVRFTLTHGWGGEWGWNDSAGSAACSDNAGLKVCKHAWGIAGRCSRFSFMVGGDGDV